MHIDVMLITEGNVAYEMLIFNAHATETIRI